MTNLIIHLKYPEDSFPYCWYPDMGLNFAVTSDESKVNCTECKIESNWRPIKDYGNYEINSRGIVRGQKSKIPLKFYVSHRTSVEVKLYNRKTKVSTSRSVRSLLKETFGIDVSNDDLIEMSDPR